MLIVHVHVRVKPEMVEAFKAATAENAANSLQEPGVARFDVCQQADDPARFVLVEVYYTPDDPARHKETAHYAKWRDTVESLLVQPRSRTRYANIAPADPGWETPGS